MAAVAVWFRVELQLGPCLNRLEYWLKKDHLARMATLIDMNSDRVRHPEKAHKPDTEIMRKPKWIRVKAPTSKGYAETRKIVRDKGLVTVCEEAACPNIGECWEKSHATFMILGEICTRACAFCNVSTGLPQAVDQNEPQKIAEAVSEMKLQHVVITSVDRDDLADGGAQHFVDVIQAIRATSPKTTIEILTPDFLRKDGATEMVIARPVPVYQIWTYGWTRRDKRRDYAGYG